MKPGLHDPRPDSIVQQALKPTRWDHVRHAPLCDDRTNELICIFLELVRQSATINPPILYQETLDPFPVYAVGRLNSLFGTNFALTIKPVLQESVLTTDQPNPVVSNDSAKM